MTSSYIALREAKESLQWWKASLRRNVFLAPSIWLCEAYPFTFTIVRYLRKDARTIIHRQPCTQIPQHFPNNFSSRNRSASASSCCIRILSQTSSSSIELWPRLFMSPRRATEKRLFEDDVGKFFPDLLAAVGVIERLWSSLKSEISVSTSCKGSKTGTGVSCVNLECGVTRGDAFPRLCLRSSCGCWFWKKWEWNFFWRTWELPADGIFEQLPIFHPSFSLSWSQASGVCRNISPRQHPCLVPWEHRYKPWRREGRSLQKAQPVW